MTTTTKVVELSNKHWRCVLAAVALGRAQGHKMTHQDRVTTTEAERLIATQLGWSNPQ